jgi:hypothetical protein
MSARRAAWVRYGEPLTQDQLDFAADHYQVAILQPWEVEAAGHLKDVRPDMTVLTYKCLSSSRSYEPGPVYTSGVGFDEAEEVGEEWFAHRADGQRIEWRGYAGHWQMAVWDPEYRQRWCENVVDEVAESPWDGILADNDVFDDYYGLRPPLEGGRTMVDLRAALDELVAVAGKGLNEAGKLLVPNIAEARREPGRWARHAAFGGGFEEVWLAWGPEDHLDPIAALAQAPQATGPGLTILRTATDGSPDHHNVKYGLAGLWVFGAGRGAYTATAHDAYSGTPFIPEQNWDLGEPLGPPRQRGNGWCREFDRGWAALNLNAGRRRKITFHAPDGLQDVTGTRVGGRVTLAPHEGAVYRRDA